MIFSPNTPIVADVVSLTTSHENKNCHLYGMADLRGPLLIILAMQVFSFAGYAEVLKLCLLMVVFKQLNPYYRNQK